MRYDTDDGVVRWVGNWLSGKRQELGLKDLGVCVEWSTSKASMGLVFWVKS